MNLRPVVYCLLALFLLACQDPENIAIKEDPFLREIDQLLSDQHGLILGQEVRKNVSSLGDTHEMVLTIDSAFFSADLEILGGKQLSRVFRPASYTKSTEGSMITLNRKKGERKGPKYMKVQTGAEGAVTQLEILEESDNMLFSTRTISQYTFVKGRLTSYQIEGMQKIIGLDPSEYKITGEIEVP